ncbi:deoxyribose-phosphate aldolase [Neisseria leonii]|uniref:Deoxyribose-phosphate aldolase n=1 Tax=Neisseria leonii TaxID=2995413 RepID=A0A9X4IB65_9NEIS|nr:deoxyribose-phosphate aldolase [Neisseria sp. 51.81]MDD9328105.1 deoxyribose-phosphate aldolase [Neisseria sp. 51.81]
MNRADLIDHTLLAAHAAQTDIEQLCREAAEYGFFSVCVNPVWVAHAKALLRESGVKVCTVVGFPLGASTAAVKAWETAAAVADGADEIDMVMNIGQAKSGNWAEVERDISAVVAAAEGSAAVKVILETCLLSEAEIRQACAAALAAGADFVKTSTGFSTGGASVAAVRLMRECVGTQMGVKASGGIRSAADMSAMLAAGATRIGASAGAVLLDDTLGETHHDY